MQRIGLALSGGGTRAMAFHAGVLKWMSEESLLKDISHISTVSGGSLFIGLVFHLSGNKWPSSRAYLQIVLPRIEDLLTKHSLQYDSFKRLLFDRHNWQFFLNRAQVLSQSIEGLWGVSSCMRSLPAKPIWTINGSTAETGRRFRFKGASAGDYKLGYAQVPDYPVASAMAMSAAFPVGIGPLPFHPTEYKWKKKTNWDNEDFSEISPPFKKLNLYDGGVYDNLGMEPLYDSGRQRFKIDNGDDSITSLLISDAGAAYCHPKLPHPLNPLRTKVIMDIMQEQTRALRVRSFVHFLQANDEGGALRKGCISRLGLAQKTRLKHLYLAKKCKKSSSHLTLG